MNTYYDTSCKHFLFYFTFSVVTFDSVIKKDKYILNFLCFTSFVDKHQKRFRHDSMATCMEFENIWNIEVLKNCVLLVTKGNIKPVSFSH